MKDRKHDDSTSFGMEEHGVGETTHRHAADFLVLDGKTLWLPSRKIDCVVYF